MKFLRKMTFLPGFLLFLTVFIAFISIDIFVETRLPFARRVSVRSGSLAPGEELRIVQISDVHSRPFLSPRLLNKVIEFRPHFIAISGDLINDIDKDYSTAFSWAEGLINVAPVYFVPGNHELASADRGWEIINGLRDRGVVILRNSSVEIGNPGATLAGIDDISLGEPDLKKTLSSAAGFTVLLSHSPLVVEKIKPEDRVDLILSGDTHGGQIRLPFYGPIFMPPRKGDRRLSKGLAKLPSGKWLYVDSGYGTSQIPVRIFNRSQISLITVKGDN